MRSSSDVRIAYLLEYTLQVDLIARHKHEHSIRTSVYRTDLGSPHDRHPIKQLHTQQPHLFIFHLSPFIIIPPTLQKCHASHPSQQHPTPNPSSRTSPSPKTPTTHKPTTPSAPASAPTPKSTSSPTPKSGKKQGRCQSTYTKHTARTGSGSCTRLQHPRMHLTCLFRVMCRGRNGTLGARLLFRMR